MNNLIVCLGPICSGKTTWSLNYIKDNVGVCRFSFDEFTKMCKGNGLYDEEIKKTSILTMFSLLQRFDVVLDGFPLICEDLDSLLEFAKNASLRLFDVKLDESIKRNFNRRNEEGKFVPVKEIIRYYTKYQEFLCSSGFLNLESKAEVFINNKSYENLHLIF